jgi:hypothetical protein
MAATDESPDRGHTFTIAAAVRGSSVVVGDEHHTDAPSTRLFGYVQVRAWSLGLALAEVAKLPLTAWRSETDATLEQLQDRAAEALGIDRVRAAYQVGVRAAEAAFDAMWADHTYGEQAPSTAWAADLSQRLTELALDADAARPEDTFPEWLFQRFSPDLVFTGPLAHDAWLALTQDDRDYWAHEAAAVRRAAARDGFKDPL